MELEPEDDKITLRELAAYLAGFAIYFLIMHAMLWTEYPTSEMVLPGVTASAPTQQPYKGCEQ